MGTTPPQLRYNACVKTRSRVRKSGSPSSPKSTSTETTPPEDLGVDTALFFGDSVVFSFVIIITFRRLDPTTYPITRPTLPRIICHLSGGEIRRTGGECRGPSGRRISPTDSRSVEARTMPMGPVCKHVKAAEASSSVATLPRIGRFRGTLRISGSRRPVGSSSSSSSSAWVLILLAWLVEPYVRSTERERVDSPTPAETALLGVVRVVVRARRCGFRVWVAGGGIASSIGITAGCPRVGGVVRVFVVVGIVLSAKAPLLQASMKPSMKPSLETAVQCGVETPSP
ncbi:hypothetical protein F4861DRAFT_489738 [Xylaria intraflava]|nr:hypothetical protein F4861DRAFT_489738 [Xylaria intraflava]